MEMKLVIYPGFRDDWEQILSVLKLQRRVLKQQPGTFKALDVTEPLDLCITTLQSLLEKTESGPRE